MTNCTFAGNSAKFGGAISNGVDALTVTNSTFSNNSAQYGGAIFSDGDTVFILNSTLSGNSAALGGGAINNLGPGTAEITNSTISGNTATVGGGIWGGSVTLKNSILANSGANCNVDPPFTADSSNLATDGSCDGATFSASINLGPLANNGGPTETMALLAGSTAINAGNNAHVPLLLTTDQRGTGFARIKFGTVDVGAFERSTSTVTNIDDSGTGSLRQAILDANASPGADTIDFSVSGTILLASPLEITDTLTIDGAGQAVTISGNHSVQVMKVSGVPALPELKLNALTIIDGDAEPGGLGAAIQGVDWNLTVTDCAFYGNRAEAGGAIHWWGIVTVAHSTFSNNSVSGAGGGAINNVGPLNVTDSTFSGNSAQAGNGGAFSNVGTLNVTKSTFSGNSAQSGGAFHNTGTAGTVTSSTFSNHVGGAIEVYGGLDLINSTLSGNTTSGFGGAISIASGGPSSTVHITNSTLSGNSAAAGQGGGIGSIYGVSVILRNSIVANSPSGGDCFNYYPPIDADASNMAGDGSCGGATTSASINLGPLQNNGGPTETMALLANSAAINAGTDADAVAALLTTDQRGTGFVRIGLGRVDVGAFELQQCYAGQWYDGLGCVDASPGYFVPFPGATSQTPCALGYFQPNSGSVSCNAATAGHYVAFTGQLAESACSLGTYQPNIASASCLLAPAGRYVDATGAIASTLCAAGKYQPNTGQTSCLLADPGFYVPSAGSASQFPCALGFTSLAGATVCTPIVPVFPANSILDNFNRANGAVGNNWTIANSTAQYKIASTRLDVLLGGALVWKPTSFGTSQEAFVRLSTIDRRGPSQGVMLKAQNGIVPNSGAILVVYDALARAVRVSTLRFNVPVWMHYRNVAATFVNGDQFGARALASGSVEIYKNGALIATVALNASDQAFFNSKGGKIGLWTLAAPNSFFDDFGGGTIVP